MKPIAYIAALLVPALVTGCSNPADDAPKAQTAEAAVVDAAPQDSAAEVLPINPETTKLEFVGSKVTGSHDGGFKELKGTFHVVPDRLEESRLQTEIDMNSTWSDSDRLTAHLKNEDFFDVQKYPTAEFVSTKIVPNKDAEGTHTITGNLTLHGVTKSITFPATLEVTDGAASLNSEFAINRKDFGIAYAGSPDNLIRDEVLIKLSIRAPRNSSNAAPANEPENAG